MQYAKEVLYKNLLYLWRVLPLPEWVRWLIVWGGNAHFLAGAAALIVDDKGHVLLFRHTYRTRHQWGLPGGWIGRGERPEAALLRELREEGGLEIVVDRVAEVDMDVRYRHIGLIYHCHIVGGAFRPSPEISSCAYFAPDALPDIIPVQRRQIARALSSQAP